jgi:nicotinate-nucleotide pyrophosphorylase
MRITLDVLEEFLKEDHAQSDSLAKLLYNSKQEITVSFIAKATGVVSGVETAM